MLRTRLPLPGLPLAVRLACVRHAASVHPEPGSNSPYSVLLYSLPALHAQAQGLRILDWVLCLPYHSLVVKVVSNTTADVSIGGGIDTQQQVLSSRA